MSKYSSLKIEAPTYNYFYSNYINIGFSETDWSHLPAVRAPKGSTKSAKPTIIRNFNQSEYDGPGHYRGILYSFTVNSIVYGAYIPGQVGDSSELKVEYSPADPSQHRIHGITDGSTHYDLGKILNGQDKIFELVRSGDWEGVLEFTDQVLEVRAQPEFQMLRSWFPARRSNLISITRSWMKQKDRSPLADVDYPLVTNGFNTIFAGLLQNICDGGSPLPESSHKLLTDSALSSRNPSYMAICMFALSHWNAKGSHIKPLAKVVDKTDGVWRLDSFIRRFETSLALNSVKALWRGRPLDPYLDATPRPVPSHDQLAGEYLESALKQLEHCAEDQMLASGIENLLRERLEKLNAGTEIVDKYMRMFHAQLRR